MLPILKESFCFVWSRRLKCRAQSVPYVMWLGISSLGEDHKSWVTHCVQKLILGRFRFITGEIREEGVGKPIFLLEEAEVSYPLSSREWFLVGVSTEVSQERRHRGVPALLFKKQEKFSETSCKRNTCSGVITEASQERRPWNAIVYFKCGNIP